MATLSFDGETHDEILAKVKRWIASVEGGGHDRPLSPTEAIGAGAELTKDALRIIAQAAPAPVAQSDVVKGLTNLGYTATDQVAKTAIDALDSLSAVTGGGLVKKVLDAQATALYEMNQAVAKQVLKGFARAASPKR
jgi:hypothetical protein